MTITLSRSARRLVNRAWRLLAERLLAPPAGGEPTPDNIRKLLKRSPSRAVDAYRRYRDLGGEPHRFRPRELERLISAGVE